MIQKKIEIKREHIYSFFADGENIGKFTKTSDWNGMCKFEGEKGEIILNLEGLPFAEFLGMNQEAKVVKASHDILKNILKEDLEDPLELALKEAREVYSESGHTEKVMEALDYIELSAQALREKREKESE